MIGVARSGTTLLRYLLDAHPEVCCPAETNLAQAFQTIFYSHSVASGAPNHPEEWEPDAIASCRALAERVMGAAAERAKKRRWCDKSLSTVEHVDLVVKVFPDAKIISLVRRCRDVVVSALEACPWGLAGFGFEPFVRDTPTNHVHALVRCWIDRVQKQIEAEKLYPDMIYRVAYEDLVTNPVLVLPAICNFIGIDYDSGYFKNDRVFDVPPTIGPEDHKISYTRGIHRESIGRGNLLPLEYIVPPELIAEMADLERRVGLEAHDRRDATPVSASVSRIQLLARHHELARIVRARFESAGGAMVRRISGDRYPFDATIIIEDSSGQAEMSVLDGAVVERASPAPITLRVKCEALSALIAGDVSASEVARRSLVIAENPDGSAPDPATGYASVRTFLRIVSDSQRDDSGAVPLAMVGEAT